LPSFVPSKHLKMQSLELLPEPIQAAHLSLEPFLKQRQEVAQIRHVLAIHLTHHVNPEDGLVISPPLSLVGSGSNVGSASSVRGLRREYLRCLRSNFKAREEYQKIRREHHAAEIQRPESNVNNKDQDTSGTPLELFLDVVKYRRKHERLRIVQDYVDMLAQKPAAAANHLDPKIVLEDMAPLPSVPSDVMVGAGSRQGSPRTDLNGLVEHLEKSVLRAKLQLKREQKLLARVRTEGQSRSIPSTSSGRRLQALGTARNELITWIELELSKAGESAADSESEQSPQSTEMKGRDYINSQLSSIQGQYSEYIKVRQSLITAAARTTAIPPRTPAEDDAVHLRPTDEVDLLAPFSHVLQPWLEELTSVSTQQKSMIQQKSHLTISLSKQLKEAGQGLDRLAEESHLLPEYPLGPQHKGFKSSSYFGEEIASHEKPDSSHRARAWVHASEAANKATKEAVANKLEEGEAAISDARRLLLNVLSLFGEDNDGGTEGGKLPNDIWTTLDGNFGAIARSGAEA
jgi:hypothetical protein